MVPGIYSLLQVVLKVAGDALVKMDAGVASHVVLLAGIGEEVGLGATLDAGIEERQAVLGHDGVVVIARDDLQAALQTVGLVDEAGLRVALGVLLRGC